MSGHVLLHILQSIGHQPEADRVFQTQVAIE
jgi:hypothetical protein